MLDAGMDDVVSKPFRIGVGKLRGVESFGMLCSARELKIADEHGGLLELAADAPVGTDVRQWLKLDDTVFTLKLTPNLGHCLSVYGVAREVAALTGARLNALPTPVVPVAQQRVLPVTVAEDLVVCTVVGFPSGAHESEVKAAEAALDSLGPVEGA